MLVETKLPETTSGIYDSVPLMKWKLSEPDRHFQWQASNKIMACASVWIKETASYDHHFTAYVGHLATEREDDGVLLLIALMDWLRDNGLEYVVGPLDGSTWFDYRLTQDVSSKPLFFGEPFHPDHFESMFNRCGFDVIENYVSVEQQNMSITDARLTAASDRLTQSGIEITNASALDLNTLLKDAYDLCISAFKSNPFYHDISFEKFMVLYLPLMSKLPKDYCLAAYDQDSLVGFLLGYPQDDALILKTVAVASQKKYGGLGSVMLEKLCTIASKNGQSKAIHALIHESNQSLNTGRKFGDVCRRYHLLGAKL